MFILGAIVKLKTILESNFDDESETMRLKVQLFYGPVNKQTQSS